MRILFFCGIVMFSCLLMGATWGGSDNEEISPTQYSALLYWREIDNTLFKEKLMPQIDKAMEDGKITVAELVDIEAHIGKVADVFYQAASKPSMQEKLLSAFDSAKKEGVDLGSKLGEVLSEQLPKFLDDALKGFGKDSATPDSAPGQDGVPL